SEITLNQIVVADPSTQKIPEIYPQNWGKLLAKFWGFLLAGNNLRFMYAWRSSNSRAVRLVLRKYTSFTSGRSV
ncbi:MAG: hypothetical protein WBM27_02775, partial [bacterium]